MKRKSSVILLIAAILSIVAIPLIINEAYKANSGYVTVWTGAEFLAYYGTILAAVCGFGGVFFTIKYSQKEYREDARQRIMPFIATQFFLREKSFEDFGEKPVLDNVADNNAYDHFTITYDVKSGVKYPLYLSNEKIRLLQQQRGYCTEYAETDKFHREPKIIYFFSCVLRNVGVGASLKTTVGLYKLKDEKYSETIDKRKTYKPRLLIQGEQIYVGFFFDLSDPDALGIYAFDIMYSDLNYTRYRRSITIEFSLNNSTKIIECTRTDTATHEIFSEKEDLGAL